MEAPGFASGAFGLGFFLRNGVPKKTRREHGRRPHRGQGNLRRLSTALWGARGCACIKGPRFSTHDKHRTLTELMTNQELPHAQLRRLLRDKCHAQPAAYARCRGRSRMPVSAGCSVQELEQMLAVMSRREATRERSAQYRRSSAARARAFRAERAETSHLCCE